MIVERSPHPQFVSNTFLIADGNGGPGVFIDAGGPVEPLIEAAERLGLSPTHVLLTHHHYDHVCELGTLLERWPGLEVLISARERELLAASAPEGAEDPTAAMGTVEAGQTLEFGNCGSGRCTRPGTRPGCSPSWSHDGARRPVRLPSSPGTRCSRARSGASKPPATRPTPTCATRSWAR